MRRFTSILIHSSSALLFCAAAFGAGSISTNKSTYTLLEPVLVSFSGASGAADDWVSIVKAGAPATDYLTYQKTNGALSGTLTFDIQEPGSYEARLYFRNSYNVETRVNFTVVFPNTAIGTDKSSYGLLDKIVVTYTNMPGFNKDYVTIVPLATPDNTYGGYQWCTGKNGVLTFDPPATTSTAGTWEVRAMYRNENGPVRARARFTIGEPTVTLQTNKSTYAINEPITVTYSGMPGYNQDWVGLFNAGDPNTSYITYQITATKKSGTMTFTAGLSKAGNYEARAFVTVHVVSAATGAARVRRPDSDGSSRRQ